MADYVTTVILKRKLYQADFSDAPVSDPGDGRLWVNNGFFVRGNASIAAALGYTPANDANVVHKTGDETIAGVKTFSGTHVNVNKIDFGIAGNISNADNQIRVDVGYTFNVNAASTEFLNTGAASSTPIISIAAQGSKAFRVRNFGPETMSIGADGVIKTGSATEYTQIEHLGVSGTYFGSMQTGGAKRGTTIHGSALYFNTGASGYGTTRLLIDSLGNITASGTVTSSAYQGTFRAEGSNGGFIEMRAAAGVSFRSNEAVSFYNAAENAFQLLNTGGITAIGAISASTGISAPYLWLGGDGSTPVLRYNGGKVVIYTPSYNTAGLLIGSAVDDSTGASAKINLDGATGNITAGGRIYISDANLLLGQRDFGWPVSGAIANASGNPIKLYSNSGVDILNNGGTAFSGLSVGGITASGLTLGTFPSGPTTSPLNVKTDGSGRAATIAASSSEYFSILAGGVLKGFVGSGAVPFVIQSSTVKIAADNPIEFVQNDYTTPRGIATGAITASGYITVPENIWAIRGGSSERLYFHNDGFSIYKATAHYFRDNAGLGLVNIDPSGNLYAAGTISCPSGVYGNELFASRASETSVWANNTADSSFTRINSGGFIQNSQSNFQFLNGSGNPQEIRTGAIIATGRMTLKDDGAGTSGVWFNKSAAGGAGNAAFVGLESDTLLSVYSSALGAFIHRTNLATGALEIAGALNLPVNTWSIKAGGEDRMYFQPIGDAFLKSDGFHFRKNDGSNLADLDNTGFSMTGSRWLQSNSLVLRNGGSFNGDNQVLFGWSGTSSYPHFITTDHNASTAVGNRIRFYTHGGTSFDVTGSVLGLTIENGGISTGAITASGHITTASSAYYLGAGSSSLSDSDLILGGSCWLQKYASGGFRARTNWSGGPGWVTNLDFQQDGTVAVNTALYIGNNTVNDIRWYRTGAGIAKQQVYDAGLAAWQDGVVMDSDGAGIKQGWFGATPVGQQTGGAATASGTYGATEQGMLQIVYDALRAFGFLS